MLTEKRKNQYLLELTTDILDCGSLDIEKLIELLDIANVYDYSSYDIIENCYNLKLKNEKLNINDLIYSAIEIIFNEIISRLEDYLETEAKHDLNLNNYQLEYLKDRIEDLRSDFMPHINYIDSHFNNILDNYTYEELKDFDKLKVKLINDLLKDYNEDDYIFDEE